MCIAVRMWTAAVNKTAINLKWQVDNLKLIKYFLLLWMYIHTFLVTNTVGHSCHCATTVAFGPVTYSYKGVHETKLCDWHLIHDKLAISSCCCHTVASGWLPTSTISSIHAIYLFLTALSSIFARLNKCCFHLRRVAGLSHLHAFLGKNQIALVGRPHTFVGGTSHILTFFSF